MIARLVLAALLDGRYAKLPSNDWGAPNGLTSDSDCDLKGAE